ncbi:DUF3592 domain-containing protein [Cognatishimia sp. F0-27]|uniref:DUF3592 domain-containing protein n=1 Tax=Cognatishimia sp. F0-27 TaxID=2816855 RepID=UPI001D0C9A29|nr:DUF3592 domain-containing protein [Cognatishimia sp. F0-27]MCC1493366.1 DUF3592 domain-containing protein [Cognatishimia sp. F0-27]
MPRRAVDHRPPVAIWRLFWRLGGWAATIPAALCVFITMGAATLKVQADRFDASAIETTAEVTDRHRTEVADEDGGTEITYELALVFPMQGGHEMHVLHPVDAAVFEAQTVGTTLPVWYLPDAPETIEITRGETRFGARLAQAVALVLGLATLITGWLPARRAVDAVRARRYAERQTARITSHDRTAWEENGKPRYRISWQSEEGRIGQSMLRSAADLRDFPIGTPITVFKGLRRDWWINDVGDRDLK